MSKRKLDVDYAGAQKGASVVVDDFKAAFCVRIGMGTRGWLVVTRVLDDGRHRCWVADKIPASSTSRSAARKLAALPVGGEYFLPIPASVHDAHRTVKDAIALAKREGRRMYRAVKHVKPRYGFAIKRLEDEPERPDAEPFEYGLRIPGAKGGPEAGWRARR